MLEQGRTVGRYTVDAQIGQGGMAAVYRVRDSGGAPFALKILLLRNDDLKERFCQEAEIQCALEHPHIVRGIEQIEVDDAPGLVMELVPGRTLDQWLLWDDRRLVADRDRISRQMIDAVGFAHAHGLVHRDLKPGNILVEERAGVPFAKVTDFGLAKTVHGLASTKTGIALGTPRYMAPEQIRDAKRVDARADIWSLGAVLFEMYTGRPAFHREALIDIYTAVTEGAYTDPAELGVPARVCDAIRGALRVDPAERWPDCRALLHALGVEPSYPPGSLRHRLQSASPSPPTVPPPPPPTPPRALLLPGSRPGEALPHSESVEDTSSVTLLPVSDPEMEPVSTPKPDPNSPTIYRPPPPPPVNAALIVSTPMPMPRRRRRRREEPAWPVLTWILAWVVALLLVVGAFIAGVVVLGGVVTFGSL